MKCEICQRESDSLMCRSCIVSYERYSHEEASVMGAIIWTARRSRRYAGRMPDRDRNTTMHLRDFILDQLGAVDDRPTTRFLNAAGTMLKRWIAADAKARR